jgi:hypothetical protein
MDVAFLGECIVRDTSRRSTSPPLYVQALCWSRTAQGWAALAQSWDSIRAGREQSTSSLKLSRSMPTPASWVHAAVPMLGVHFRDSTAEESTLAAWLTRAQVSFAVAITGDDATMAKVADALPYRAAVGECLDGYQDFLKTPGYSPVRLVMAAAQPPSREAGLAEAFREVRARTGVASALDGMQFRTCTAGAEPLPLALANLASAAILRFVTQPATANPIHDAVRAKLVAVPRRIAALEVRNRR